jgi:hypothetical protein
MAATMENRKATKFKWLLPLFKGYIYATAGFLGPVGFILLIVTWTCKVPAIQPWLSAPDPLFGMSNRMMLLLAGVLHLFFAGCLLLKRDIFSQWLLALLVGWSYFLLRITLVWSIDTKAPYPIEAFIGWRIGVKPETIDLWWKVFTVFLLVLSSIFVLLEFWRLKQVKNVAWLRHWQETRNQSR